MAADPQISGNDETDENPGGDVGVWQLNSAKTGQKEGVSGDLAYDDTADDHKQTES